MVIYVIFICKESLSKQIIKGKDYFCFEIYFNQRKNSVSYRIVNEYKEIAIYDMDYFEPKGKALLNMVFKTQDDLCIIQLRAIDELDGECFNVNGLWGEYYDGGNPVLEEKVHNIIIGQAKLEGLYISAINTA